MPGLGRQYLSINNVLLPETSGFDMDFETIENLYQTEAGTDTSVFIRGGKLKISVKWDGATSSFLDQVKGYCSTESVLVGFRGYSYTCRARDLKASMSRYSNRYNGSEGLWDISFTLTEF